MRGLLHELKRISVDLDAVPSFRERTPLRSYYYQNPYSDKPLPAIQFALHGATHIDLSWRVAAATAMEEFWERPQVLECVVVDFSYLAEFIQPFLENRNGGRKGIGAFLRSDLDDSELSDLVSGLRIGRRELTERVGSMTEEFRNRFVLLRTDWWSNFAGRAQRLNHPIFELRHAYLVHPYLTKPAAELLASWGVAGIGTDSPSLENPLTYVQRENTLVAVDGVLKSAKKQGLLTEPGAIGCLLSEIEPPVPCLRLLGGLRDVRGLGMSDVTLGHVIIAPMPRLRDGAGVVCEAFCHIPESGSLSCARVRELADAFDEATRLSWPSVPERGNPGAVQATSSLQMRVGHPSTSFLVPLHEGAHFDILVSENRPDLGANVLLEPIEYDTVVLDMSRHANDVSSLLVPPQPRRGTRMPFLDWEAMGKGGAAALLEMLCISRDHLESSLSHVDLQSRFLLIRTLWTDTFLPHMYDMDSPALEMLSAYLTHPWIERAGLEYLTSRGIAGLGVDAPGLTMPYFSWHRSIRSQVRFADVLDDIELKEPPLELGEIESEFGTKPQPGVYIRNLGNTVKVDVREGGLSHGRTFVVPFAASLSAQIDHARTTNLPAQFAALPCEVWYVAR